LRRDYSFTCMAYRRSMLQAQFIKKFKLWQTCHEIVEKHSKIVPLGAP
jgi:hypothetical protein